MADQLTLFLLSATGNARDVQSAEILFSESGKIVCISLRVAHNLSPLPHFAAASGERKEEWREAKYYYVTGYSADLLVISQNLHVGFNYDSL